MIKIPILDIHDQDFPPAEHALDDPNGLLAAGGDLSTQRLVKAYSQGIFPWYSEGQPILWWSPAPRAVLFPEELHISKSLAKVLRKKTYRITMDTAFNEVIRACSEPRRYSEDTWITEDMIQAYQHLHTLGYAHSVEAWKGEDLVGGLYGIALGKMYFGESMFSRADNASKVAFVHLVKQLESWGFPLIDCQVGNDHLDSLGSRDIPRTEFQAWLNRCVPKLALLMNTPSPSWKMTWKYSDI